MVKRSFEVCGITSSDPVKIRDGAFYQKCIEKAQDELDMDEDENDDPFA